jgi:hypothetical protein
MTCEHARALIDRFVLDELSTVDARTLADHVRGCVACTAELAGASFLIELLATLPAVAPAPNFEARVLAAAVADRQRRSGEHGLASLWRQIWRGAMRTSGTLVVTLVVVALLSAAFVFAASNVVHDLGQVVGLVPATPHPAATLLRSPTPPAVAAVAPPTSAPITPSPTPAPTAPPTERAAATPTPSLTPAPSPSARVTPPPVVMAAPTAPPSAAPSANPTPAPSASSTPKPRRCPPGTACYSPSPSPSATGSASP